MKSFFCDDALLPSGWAKAVRVVVGSSGRIEHVEKDAPPQSEDSYLKNQILLPAPVNLHSHAFQRAMAGLTEAQGPDGKDSFWSWRKLMYRFLEQLTPEQMQAIATLAQIEMLEAGYGCVAEFHYLHHQADGSAYDNPAEMSERVMAAAEISGIGLTHLPVFYERGGLDNRELSGGQKRFKHSLDAFDELMNSVKANLASDQQLGIAPHSLRAASRESLEHLVAHYSDGPIHIHIAEQMAEVEEVQEHYQTRPIEWLYEHLDVNEHWCLIHATHVNEAELKAIAKSGAVVGLCPVTEANLGDGIFPASEFCGRGGRIGVGTDSNVNISLTEELRLLEYSQRLSQQERVLLADEKRSTGRYLFDAALAGGAQAANRNSGAIEQGKWADMLTLDASHICMTARKGNAWLDSWLFAANTSLVKQVFSAGRHMVVDGHHIAKDSATTAFKRVMRELQVSV